MNKPLLGRILAVLLAFSLISLAAFFAYAAFTFSPNRLLTNLRWEYALKKSLVQFIDFLVPVSAAAIAVAVSLPSATSAPKPKESAGIPRRNESAGIPRRNESAGIPRRKAGPSRPFSRIISSTLVAFILLASAYAVLFEAAHPILLRRLSAMEYQTEIAREYMLRAEENRKKGDYLASLRAMEGYLAIDPRSKEAAALRLSLEPQAAKQKAAMTARPPEEDVVPAGASAEGLVAKARSSFAQGDWYSAHYFAQQASRLDPSRSDALRLAVQAWDRITSAERASADAAQMELFQKKTAAYALLAKRNDPVAAYYAFLALSVRYPKDQDIATYLARAGEEARKVSFFLDEVRGIETLPGTRRILFLERKERGSIEAVFIGKMIETAQGTAYLFDTEAIRYAPSGAVAWHFTAPYGKLHGGVLLMQCLDGSNPDLRSLPLYHQGARPAAERNLLALRPTVEELRALSMDRGALSAMGLPELWRLRTDLGSLGISRESLNMEMAKKAVMPFAYLILALFSLSLGWALRDRTVGRPSAFSIILVPLVPVVVSLASLLYIHAHRILLGFTFLAFGLTVAAIVFAALQLALLVIALVLIAGQAAH